MPASPRVPASGTKLGCEALEDRATPTAAYGLSGNNLLAFDTAHPATTAPTAITGVQSGEALVGLDFRPSDDALYALGVNASANTGTLYTVSPTTGAATAVGTPGGVAFVDALGAAIDLPAASVGYGLSFNPASDELGVVTGSGLTFRVDPAAGAAVDGDTGLPGGVSGTNTDGVITGLPSGTGLTATAFAADPASSAAVQYTLDAGSNALYVQTAAGAQTGRVNLTRGGTALDFSRANGFDIAGGVGYAALTVNGSSHLYQIDLATGATTDLGAAATGLSGLTIAPPAGAIAFTGATFTASETGTGAEVTLTRTGGSAGAVAVTVTAANGTAAAGTDFTAGPWTVNFADGATTATLNIPITDDKAAEGDEAFTLALSAPTGGAALGAQATATVSITDGPPLPPPASAQPPALAIGSGTGGVVEMLNADHSVRYGFLPYGVGMTGAVRVVTADVTGDGVADVITAPVASAPHVKVFDGATRAEIQSFLAFDPEFLGGITIAAGDVTGDGRADVIVGAANGSSHVKVFDGPTGDLRASFLAYGAFGGGVTVAAGDVNGDGRADIITGTATGNSHVKVFDGNSLQVVRSFYSFIGYTGGVNVAAGDLNGDGRADIIVGTAVGNSHVKVYDGETGALRYSFRGFAPTYTGGVNVAARDANGDGLVDILVSTATGSSHVRGFAGGTAAEVNSFLAFGAGFQGGVFIN